MVNREWFTLGFKRGLRTRDIWANLRALARGIEVPKPGRIGKFAP